MLVVVDESDKADAALREAVRMASSPGDALAALVLTPDTTALAPMRERLAAAGAAHAEMFATSHAVPRVVVQRADAWGADVIVVAGPDRGEHPRLLPSFAERVLRRAHCRVLVERPAEPGGWVLAATDLTEASLSAVLVAAEEARRRGAKLEIVYVMGFLEDEVAYIFELATPVVSPDTTPRDIAERRLKEAVARLGIEATCEVLEQPPADAIAIEARAIGAEVIVVGSHGRTRLGRLALGSISERVVSLAPCSVLVVKPTRAERRERSLTGRALRLLRRRSSAAPS